MSYLIALSDGHGSTTAGKRTPPIASLGGRVIRENEFNREVVKYLDVELKRCGFRTLLVAPTDADTSLTARTNLANSNKADAYVSIHYNAFDGSFGGSNPEGISIHIFPGSVSGRKLAESILKYLKQGTPQVVRGIKEDNFHELRETKMVSVLLENGFMDNLREALLMINVDFQKEVAKETAQGICEYFKVPYKVEVEKTLVGALYRVQTGAFKNKSNAEALMVQVKSKGFQTYMVQDGGLFKVQVGAFSKKPNADALAAKLKASGFNVFITTKSGSPVTSNPTPKPVPTKTVKVGSKVKVKSGSKTFEGQGLADFVYKTTYEVIQLNGNRAVIGSGKVVIAAVNKSNLIVQ